MAAVENNDQNENQLRAVFQVNKLWNGFFKKKMDNEMRKFSHHEEAFQKIKTSTGQSDV